jgi:trimeric autotransporter adhesin
MSTRTWLGHAPAVAQVQSWTLSGTWETTDTITLTINGKAVVFTAGSATIKTIVDAMVATYNALSSATHPEFAEMTASNVGDTAFVLTADTAGRPFTATMTTADSGGAADDQRIEGDVTATTGTASVANAGPNCWSTAANWSGGAVPVNSDDVVFENSAVDCLYGIDQNAVTLTSLTIKQSYTGLIGLPRTNATATSYVEYRDTYLKISATTITIGQGDGSGSGRIKINVGTAATTAHILNTGTPKEAGIESVLLLGTHANNVVNVSKGSVGIAVFAGETSTVATLRVGYVSNQAGDSSVRCGSGVTLTNISKSGGKLDIASDTTAVTQSAGDLYCRAGTPTAITINGGTLYYQSTANVASLVVAGGGVADFSQDLRAKVVTACDIYSGATIKDPFGIVTWSGGIDCVECGAEDVKLYLGKHRRLTPGAVA